MLKASLKNEITIAAAGWLRVGVVPCEAAIVDRGPRAAGGCRFAVELSHARGKTAADSITLEECSSRAAAAALAADVEAELETICAAHRRRPAA